MASCLIIDDDRMVRKMAEEILTGHGYEVQAAATGEEGWACFQRDSANLVLLDLVLPDVSGYELLPRFSGSGAGSRVIVTTGYFSLDSALQALREGAGDYLPKPFSEETLLMSVERVLKRMSLERENRELSALLQRRVDELSVLHKISQLVISSKQMGRWMDAVMRATCSYVGAQAGSLLLLDAGSDELFFYVSHGPKGEAIREVRLPRGQGIAWRCLEERRALKVDDASLEPCFDGSVDAQTGFVTTSILVVPIVVGDDCIGVIELLNKVGQPCFSDDDLVRLQELSSHIAMAVQNAMVVRDLQRSRQELSSWSRQLEQIIEERTRALQAANRARQIAFKDLERSHRKLKQAHARLVEREKMAAVGLLSAGVAHEINNPLGFVNANLSTLESYVRSLRRLAGVVTHAGSRARTGNREQVARLLGEAARVIEEEKIKDVLEDMDSLFNEVTSGLARITAIVEQLRAFAGDGSSERTRVEVDLNEEVSRLVELVQGAAAEKIDFSCQFSQLPAVRVPVMDLRQILLNLLSPATLAQADSKEVILRTSVRNGHAVLEVVDPKSPVSERDVAKLFDPFFEPGSDMQTGGLGLSAAYGLARALGGALRAYKSAEGGLCIELVLPAGDGNVEEPIQ